MVLAVKRSHVELLAFCWIELVPRHYPAISVQDASTMWGMFRANPADPRLAKAKRMVNELFAAHVSKN